MPVVKPKEVNIDILAKRKAVKLVITHLKKKLNSFGQINNDPLDKWINKVEDLLGKDEFVLRDFFEVKKDLNDIIERTMDPDLRFKLRDSWVGFGKALEKKAKLY
ncbi:MAG: hypothetical protein J6Y29_06555 [Clostridiales bacterium]|nr:hypothetical protein [Clostridiales bacterium]